MTSSDDSNSLFWWGINIDSPDASQPGTLELQRRGNNATWYRDRHTNVSRSIRADRGWVLGVWVLGVWV